VVVDKPSLDPEQAGELRCVDEGLHVSPSRMKISRASDLTLTEPPTRTTGRSPFAANRRTVFSLTLSRLAASRHVKSGSSEWLVFVVGI
jgi:hypothetical protein